MQAILDRILTLNLIGTTAVFLVAARIYLLPRLGELAPRSVLIWVPALLVTHYVTFIILRTHRPS